MPSLNRQDFILDEDGDFPLEDTIINGVYLNTPYGDSDEQHIVDNIFYHNGWLKQFPLVGYGVSQYLNAEYSQDIYSTFKKIMLLDEYDASHNSIAPNSSGGFSIDVSYIKRI